MIIYLSIVYIFVAIMCVVGQINNSFDGNSLQRAGLGLACLWALWRIYLLSISTWGYPHEPLIATSMGLYALGTLVKTRHYCKRKNKAADYLKGKKYE